MIMLAKVLKVWKYVVLVLLILGLAVYVNWASGWKSKVYRVAGDQSGAGYFTLVSESGRALEKIRSRLGQI